MSQPGRPFCDRDRVGATLLGTGVALLAGALPVLLTVTTVSVAIDPLSRDLSMSVAAAHWVATAYLLAMAAAIPALGWLVERWGARRVWLAALLVFVVGSALCGLAWSAGSLVAFRVVQGLGGGLVLPLLQAVLAQEAGPDRLGRAMALVAVPGQVIPVLGPVVGGVLVDGPGWRWVFLVSVALCLPALALARSGIPDGAPAGPAVRFDLLGMSLLATALVALLYGLSSAGQASRFTRDALAWLAAATALGVLFARRTARHTTPGVVDRRLFAVRPFATSAAVTFLLGVCLWGPMFLLPLYLQQARGASGVDAGLLLAVQGLGTMLALLAVSRLADRAGARRIVVAGLAVATIATLPFALAGSHPGQSLLMAALFVRGLGLGAAGVPTLAVAYRDLPRHLVPRAASAISISQRLGAALGTTVFAVVVDRALHPGHDPAAAYGQAFWWVLAFTAVAVLAAWRLPSRPPNQASDATTDPPPSVQPTDHEEVHAMTDPIRTVLIVGSTREGRFGDTVARWVATQARARHDIDLDVVDLVDAALPPRLQPERDERVHRFAERIARADAIIVVTPEYNHGYPAALKQAIDWLDDEWAAKPVALASYGGISGGLRAIEQLRQVFAEMHAVTIRDTLSFHWAHRQFHPDGSLRDPSAAVAAAKTLFDQLTWWARALRDARQARPFAS